MDEWDALKVHSQLAYALLPFWRTVPEIQRVVHRQLGRWRRLTTAPSDFFTFIISELQTDGVSCTLFRDAVLAAGQIPVDDLLKQMFTAASGVARELYEVELCWLGGVPAFSPGPYLEAAYPDPGGCGALGAHGRTPTPGRGITDAEVELNLVVPLLGPPTWAEIPYVLIHELVCHASQSSLSSTQIDPFTEGWMDEVARELHAERVADVFGAREADLALEEGGKLCGMLRTLVADLPEAHHAARTARIQGVRAASLTRRLLDDLAELRPGQTGWSLFARLSVQLNTAPSAGTAKRDLARHQGFVEAIAAIAANWDDDETKEKVAKRFRYQALLRRWCLDMASAEEILSVR